MTLRHVYHQGNRVLCGLPFHEAREGVLSGRAPPADPPAPEELCPTCAARDAASRLGGFTWVTCTGCRGTGSVARPDSPVTSCFQCGNAGVMPSSSIAPRCCDCSHHKREHDFNAGCLVPGCYCNEYHE